MDVVELTPRGPKAPPITASIKKADVKERLQTAAALDIQEQKYIIMNTLECESELVALIPASDRRLNPRRTWLWVLGTFTVCLLVSVLILFFLVPRGINVSSNNPPVVNVSVVNYQPGLALYIQFLTSVNVSNENFFGVDMVNGTCSVTKVMFPDRNEVVGRGFNRSIVSIPMQSSAYEIRFNNTVKITDWTLTVCELPFGFVRLFFQFTLTFRYLFSHTEQASAESAQLVCCSPTGYC
ncbi:unnamed protein product [Soboliphyme baturini]|uniref:LEA_2 domain-containing protein n=1 Tax=Soboliphyme baturini TaxID=241478 RepID=A0A183IID8_9BILA|nr:unnamed protein product [Soboliphyme baturini]